ncbi:MAG TPA: hypothetical protein VGK43_02705 [Solirubrobacterales bacterium]
MIAGAYRVTLLIAAEHTGGRLAPTGSNSVADFLDMSFSGDRGQVWDHPPEYEVIEIAAPGTWSTVPGAPLFTLDEARARLLWGDNDEGVELDPIDRWEDSPDAIDGAITAALDYAAITSTRPGAAWIGVYPQSSGDQQPLLSVTPGDGGPLLLDPHDWSWPSDEELVGVELTIAVLRWAVERANRIVAENEARGAERPILDHVYNGAGLRLTCWDEGDEPISHAGTWETISGTFRVVAWVGEDGAIVGNGESPEQFWRTADKPERIA